MPIEAPLEPVLARYLESRRERFPAEKLNPASPLFVNRFGERLRQGGARYLVSQCHRWSGIGARVPQGALVHALRHTFATRLAEDGASATEIQRLLGHQSLNTSRGYIDSTASEQRAAARANRTYQSLERIHTAPRSLGLIAARTLVVGRGSGSGSKNALVVGSAVAPRRGRPRPPTLHRGRRRPTPAGFWDGMYDKDGRATRSTPLLEPGQDRTDQSLARTGAPAVTWEQVVCGSWWSCWGAWG